MKNLLVEIGCEELPAFVQEKLASDLSEFVAERLKDFGFEVESIKQFATPLRVGALWRVSPVSKVFEEEKVGPPRKVAYDSQKHPTLALLKFAESLGKDPKEAYVVKRGKGEYVAFKVKKGGQRVGEVMENILSSFVREVPLPKRMKWDDSGVTFIRPIRWLVVLLENEHLPVRLGNLWSDRYTYSGRLPRRLKIPIGEAGDYEKLLREVGVLPVFQERLLHIKEEVKRFFKVDPEEYEAYETDVEALLYEITGLVEKGYAVYGGFPPSFLNLLYPEVIMAAMTAHQRYVPHLEEGQLKAGFVAFSNNPKGLELHRKGYESVLKARLEDALFYKTEDLKRPLSYYVENLKNITWIRGLGSLYDRMERVKGMVRNFPLPSRADRKIIDFVATHYLFDTATSMIRDGKEFAKLEGKIGYYYARDKLTEMWDDPAKANRWAVGIYEAHLPKGRKFPKTLEGTAVAIADALTTTDGLLQIDYRWTSSKDPLGIRTNVRRFLALLLYDSNGYIFGRHDLRTYLRLTRTFTHRRKEWEGLLTDSLVNALRWVQMVFSYPYYPKDPSLILQTYDSENVFTSAVRARAYEKIIRGENREKFSTVVKRLKRILKSEARRLLKDESPQVSATYEGKLRNAVEHIEKDHLHSLENLNLNEISPMKLLDLYENYLNAVLDLYGVLDEFFSHVPVMVEDENVRENRLSLLKRAFDLINRIIPGL
ncbi:MAG: glycine--tRNA ligase subunit beta [Thermotogae bacterium]|nr:glycine--tRNA ligase subunit beta [Thermotogota bacterium]